MPKPKTLGRPPSPPAAGFNGKIGKRLRAARAKLDLTDVELAAASGVARASIHLYESGKVSAKSDTLLRLCKALKITMVELFQGY